MYKAYFDASYDWIKKRANIAYVIYDPINLVIKEEVKVRFCGDSNQAEWLALNALLKALRRLQVDQVEVYGDNQNIIDIANKTIHKTKAGQEIHRIVWKYGSKFKDISFNWISRSNNSIADKLTRIKRPPIITDQPVMRPKKNKQRVSTYLINPTEFSFKFCYKETKRKIIMK